MRQRHAAIRNAEVSIHPQSHFQIPNYHPNKVLTAHPSHPCTQVRRLRLVTASPAVVAGLADGRDTRVTRAQREVSFFLSIVWAISMTSCFFYRFARWIERRGLVSNPFSSAGQQPEGGDASTTVSEGRRALRQLVSAGLLRPIGIPLRLDDAGRGECRAVTPHHPITHLPPKY